MAATCAQNAALAVCSQANFCCVDHPTNTSASTPGACCQPGYTCCIAYPTPAGPAWAGVKCCGVGEVCRRTDVNAFCDPICPNGTAVWSRQLLQLRGVLHQRQVLHANRSLWRHVLPGSQHVHRWRLLRAPGVVRRHLLRGRTNLSRQRVLPGPPGLRRRLLPGGANVRERRMLFNNLHLRQRVLPGRRGVSGRQRRLLPAHSQEVELRAHVGQLPRRTGSRHRTVRAFL